MDSPNKACQFGRTILLVHSKHQEWDLHTRELTFAYITSVYSLTGFTPAPVQILLDMVYGSPESTNTTRYDIWISRKYRYSGIDIRRIQENDQRLVRSC